MNPYFRILDTKTLKHINQILLIHIQVLLGILVGLSLFYLLKVLVIQALQLLGVVDPELKAQVIDKSGNPIPGLFAAGEVTGGVHGGNRLGGNAVADIVIFGGIASDSAIEYCDK